MRNRGRRLGWLLSTVLGFGCQAGDGNTQGDEETAFEPTSSSGTTGTDDGPGSSSSTASSGTTGASTSTSGTSTTSTTSAETTSDESSTGEPPLPTEDVHLMGRFDMDDPAGPASTWSGTTARTRISGAEVSIALDGASGVYFQVVVDGVPTEVFITDGGPQTYPVATGLAAGEHDIEVVRRNEGYFGVVQFGGFSPGAGTTIIPTPSPYELHLEFIGDSLTAGYGIECTNGEDDFSAETENANASYAMVAARQLSASAHLIAYSGKGVFQNYGGNLDEPMPELYPRTLTTDAALLWDFSSKTPDIVVVNLGTNDFSAAIGQVDFVNAYVALLQTVRTNYPATPILGVTWAHWGAEHEGWVQAAVDQMADATISTERFVIDADDGYGCDFHTNIVSNEKFGAQLATRITALLGA